MNKKMIVIADTGPIISLAVIDKLYLLTEIFKNVFIPRAVWNELTNDNSWIENSRFYSIKLLNKVLEKYGENLIPD